MVHLNFKMEDQNQIIIIAQKQMSARVKNCFTILKSLKEQGDPIVYLVLH